MAAEEAQEAKETKEGKKGKGKEAKKAKGASLDSSGAPSVAAHPRAARAVARAKGWGGLAGFVLGGYLSLPTNTLAAAGLRALLAGVICYLVVWGGAVFLWRRLVMLEMRGRQQRLLAAAGAGAAGQPAAAPGRSHAGTS